MANSTLELRELMIELLDAWDAQGHPTEMSQPRARAGRAITTQDVARMECVVGLTRHVHETARAVQLLLDSGHHNAALPLARVVYECALTAAWLVQSKDDEGIRAFLHEYARQRTGLQSSLKRAVATTFREGEVTGTNMEDFLGSADNARRFDLICEDLEPGGTDAYIYYRILSSYSNAGVPVVDLYFSPPPLGERVPSPRLKPALALDEGLLRFLTSASMVWSGRAVTYISKDHGYRSTLRRIARALEINPEIQLSDAYRKRHAQGKTRAK